MHAFFVQMNGSLVVEDSKKKEHLDERDDNGQAKDNAPVNDHVEADIWVQICIAANHTDLALHVVVLDLCESREGKSGCCGSKFHHCVLSVMCVVN